MFDHIYTSIGGIMRSRAAAAPIVFAADRVCRGIDLTSIFHVNVPTRRGPGIGMAIRSGSTRSDLHRSFSIDGAFYSLVFAHSHPFSPVTFERGYIVKAAEGWPDLSLKAREGVFHLIPSVACLRSIRCEKGTFLRRNVCVRACITTAAIAPISYPPRGRLSSPPRRAQIYPRLLYTPSFR